MKEAKGVHPYDAARPWALVWSMSADKPSDDFWRRELIDPVVLVCLELKNMGEVVDSDAPIEPTHVNTSPHGQQIAMQPQHVPAVLDPRPKRRREEEWRWPGWRIRNTMLFVLIRRVF